MESDIPFDNAGDNVTLTLYNVTLTLYNVTLTSQNHVNTITSVIAANQTVINEVYVVVFSIKHATAIFY